MFLLSVACVTMEAVCDLMQPKAMSRLIDEGAMGGDLGIVAGQGVRMLLIACAGAAFAFARSVISSDVSQKFGSRLRLDLFERIMSLSAYDIDRFDGGSLVTRETSDVGQVQNMVNGLMRIFFKAPVMCVGAIVMAATLDLKSVPIIVPAVCLVMGVVTVSMRLAYPRFLRIQKAIDAMNTAMREYLAGIRLVKAFRRFRDEEARFRGVNDALAESSVKANNVLVICTPFMALFVNLATSLLIMFGARWVDAGDLRVGQVMAFITYMAQMLMSLNMLSNVFNMLVRVKASNERISEVMEMGGGPGAVAGDSTAGRGHEGAEARTPARIGSAEARTPARAAAGAEPHVRMEGVSFRYRGSTGMDALTGISLAIRPGGSMGVIGPTGSGKSTLAYLMLRFYDVTGGRISVFGEDIGDLPVGEWRGRIAYVPQRPTLFTGTIRENVLWGREGATDAEVMDALTQAQADDFVMASPMGLDTPIGQGGVNLSGGQRQRISIARALVRDPELIILDDCMSALDVITERDMREALRAHDFTCVTISQRISSVRQCDDVLVLDGGAMVGFGPHEALLGDCGGYRDIYRSQIGEAVP